MNKPLLSAVIAFPIAFGAFTAITGGMFPLGCAYVAVTTSALVAAGFEY